MFFVKPILSFFIFHKKIDLNDQSEESQELISHDENQKEIDEEELSFGEELVH